MRKWYRDLGVQIGSHKILMDVKYIIANIVNNIAITVYGSRRVVEMLQKTFCREYTCLAFMLCT